MLIQGIELTVCSVCRVNVIQMNDFAVLFTVIVDSVNGHRWIFIGRVSSVVGNALLDIVSAVTGILRSSRIPQINSVFVHFYRNGRFSDKGRSEDAFVKQHRLSVVTFCFLNLEF